MMRRFLYDIFMVFSFFFLPWYFTAVLVVVAIILFSTFWEGVFFVVFFDAIYAVSGGGFHGVFGVLSVIALVSVLVAERLKKEVRF